LQPFDDFIHTCVNGELENFSVANDCLDTFLRSRMAANYPKVWSVCELALLYHMDRPQYRETGR